MSVSINTYRESTHTPIVLPPLDAPSAVVRWSRLFGQFYGSAKLIRVVDHAAILVIRSWGVYPP